MAVQAQKHPLAFDDLQNRSFPIMEDKAMANPIHLVTSGCDPAAGLQQYFYSGLNVNCPKIPSSSGTRKRRKQAIDRGKTLESQHPVLFQASKATTPVNVSTGLRLAFDEDPSTISSSSDSLILFRDLLCHQQTDFGKLLSSHMNHLQQEVDEQRQMQTKALLEAAEESVKKRLKDKEVELEAINRKNTELEERAKYLGIESQLWQSKAKTSEAIIAVMRANLQQAMVQCMSKEGCGDNEVDDATSAVHTGETYGGKSSTTATRTCKLCDLKETTVVLLPCFHLCVCMDCIRFVTKCPVCGTQITASVQVYLM